MFLLVCELLALVTSLIWICCNEWRLYKTRQLLARLTDENQRMRRYLRRIHRTNEGDDMPFLPLEVNDD